MNLAAACFLLLSAAALLSLPRRWAPLPLIAGACYMTLGQGIEAGPFTFTIGRLLIATGLVRLLLRGERLRSPLNGLDWLLIAWAAWAICSTLFHSAPATVLVFRLGLVYNACGVYFLTRVFCSSIDDAVRLSRVVGIALIPVAIAMILEHVVGRNVFSVLGGISATPEIREGFIRASGPFAHPILAGTVGAVTLPLMVALWRYHRIAASLGLLVCVVIVIASQSSGPVLTSVIGIGAMVAWPLRNRTRTIRWAVVGAYIGLAIVMKAPPYYLLARIDVVGGSTGWYRARLIESAFEHLDEWWLVGTDNTRHWMTDGVGDQADIVNHYLQMGVWGGLPLMLLWVALIAKALSRTGTALRDAAVSAQRNQFVLWALGASLVAHAATWLSVSYFDQSVVFLYLTLGAIGSARVASCAPIALGPTSGKPVYFDSRAWQIRPTQGRPRRLSDRAADGARTQPDKWVMHPAPQTLERRVGTGFHAPEARRAWTRNTPTRKKGS
jgi:hypothetical protein